MSAGLSPDLRVLCRKLSSIPPQQLPHSLPCLVNHVLRCKGPLSAPQEQKLKSDSPESAQLVHKLKANVTSLLKSRNKEARFTAVALVKAMVDVGGWEVLRNSLPWVQDLLSIAQKSDPLPAKELAIVTLTRIYALLHPYQTLVREIATPTIPTFARACMNLIKPISNVQPSSTPPSVIETVCDAFSTLIPLYPPTFRPFTSETHNAIKYFLAPTGSDSATTPTSLVRAARRTCILQHYVAAKSGGSEEWTKLVDGLITNFHSTADQVFRAVDESWEPSVGITRTKVDLDSEPHSLTDELPPWHSIEAGAQRLIGLIDYLGDCLRYTTKSAVTIPLSKIIDVTARVCLIARLSPKTQTWDQALQTNAAIGRDEKEELWSSMPDIHIAALHLIQALLEKLDKDMLPLAQEGLDHLVRVFKSSISNPVMRSTGYTVLSGILLLSGSTLSKQMVGMLDPLIGACCRDLQEDAGHLKPASKPAPTDTKKNGLAANADLFLQQPQKPTDIQPTTLAPEHRSAASTLLATIFSSLPQQYLKPSLRSLLDQTAILTGDRDAMLASVLNPYRDQRGRIYPSILPHLTQQFPGDRGLEILRTNMRRDGVKINNEEDVASVADPQELDNVDEEMGEAEEEEEVEDRPEKQAEKEFIKLPKTKTMDVDVSSRPNPFESTKGGTTPAISGFGNIQTGAASPPKRKYEGAEPVKPKRHEVKAPSAPTKQAEVQHGNAEESDDDSDGSVHLNMELDDDDDDDEDEG